MASPASQRKTIFISYSHADANKAWLKRLQVHLKRLESKGSVERWDDTRIAAGADWRKEIEHALRSAVAAVLLITQDFIASDFISRYELPVLLLAAKKKGVLIIPVIAATSSYRDHAELSKLQSINPPSQTLAGMRSERQEKLWIEVVRQIDQKLAETAKRRPGSTRRKLPVIRARAPLVRTEQVPVVGQFLGRAEPIAKIRAFLASATQTTAIIQGIYGVGKTAFAAKLAELTSGDFAGIFWLTCRTDEASADVLLSALADFFGCYSDHLLRDIWNETDPKKFPLKLEILVQSLRAKRYLLVLDKFDEWLNTDFQVRNDSLRAVITTILRATHRSKVILSSRKRPLFDPEIDAVPLGNYVEETIRGLDKADAVALLRWSGLNLDEAVLGRLAVDYEGNPQLLQIASYQILKLYREPEDLFQSSDPSERVGKLLAYANQGLSKQSQDALEMMAVIRRPLTRANLRALGFRFDSAVGPLLNCFLVTEDQASKLVGIGSLVRQAIAGALTPERRSELHHRAAALWTEMMAGADGKSESDRVQFSLEKAFHLRELGDFVAAAQAVVSVTGLLIDWGYVDQAQENLDLVLAKPAENSIRAKAFSGLAPIADLRGNYELALARFNQALALFEAAADYAGTAETLYLIGRIHNATGNFDQAETFLQRCIQLCETHGIAAGRAGSELTLGWNYQERGKPTAEVQSYYESALKHSEEARDWPVFCGANRNLGFLFWDKQQNIPKAREAYARAADVAARYNLSKELSGVEIDLAYLSTVWGDAKDGEEHARNAIGLCTSMGNLYGLANAYCNLGTALEAQERWPDAASAYEEGRRVSVSIRNFGGEAFAESGQARLLHRAGETAKARQILRQAVERLQTRGLTELAATMTAELKAMQT